MHWVDGNGVEGFGHLVKPVGYVKGRRYPLVIVQYRSRGFLRGGVGDEFPIHVFASEGFAVLSFHRPDEWELEEQLNSFDDVMQQGWVGAHERRRVLSVLLAGINLLREMGVIDPEKVGITGMSDGGETVDFALIHAPERFAAAAASWTPYNPNSYYLAGPNLLPMFKSYGFEDPLEESSMVRWRDVSLAVNAANVRTPLLLQVSDTEMVGVTETFTELVHHGKPVEMYVFPNEFHVKSQPLHRYFIYKRSVQWFQFWLQGIEDPDPSKAEQYQRWEKLCDTQIAGNRNRRPFCVASKH
jgi:dipeptidyl aminopeptidase/acylaminoacyl peptidase